MSWFKKPRGLEDIYPSWLGHRILRTFRSPMSFSFLGAKLDPTSFREKQSPITVNSGWLGGFKIQNEVKQGSNV